MRKGVFCALLLLLVLLTGCAAETCETLYASEWVQVTRSGNVTTVRDVEAEKELVYITRLVRRSDGILRPYREMETDAVKVQLLPHVGLIIHDKAAGKVFTILRLSAR